MIFQAAINTHVWLGVIFIALLAIAFLGMAGVLLPMLQGNTAPSAKRPTEATLSVIAPLAMACGALGLGVFLPRWLADLLRQAAGMLGG